MVASFCVEMEVFDNIVGGLIDGSSIMLVDFLHNTLKAVTRPLDTKHEKAAFKDNEN